MYVIIVGGGRVGYHLARALIEQDHEVLIIEKNANYCNIITAELGSICVHGDGCETATLAEVGTKRADLFVAVTGDDEDNMVACQVAKHRFNVPRTIARIRNPQHDIVSQKLGIDVTVNSTNIILEHIKGEVPSHPLMHLLTIRDTGLEIVDIKISADAPTLGKSIKELSVPRNSRLALLLRKEGKPLVPTANTILQADDQIIAVTTSEDEDELRKALRGS